MANPNDMSRLADGIGAEHASRAEFSGTSAKAAQRLIRRTYNLGRTASVLANGADAFTAANGGYCICMPVAGRVLAVKVTASAAITAANANNATLAVAKLYANGTVAASVASQTTNTSGTNGGTGSFTAGVPVTLTAGALAATRYAAGTVLGVSVTQNGNGVAVTPSSWTVDVEEEDSADGYK